MRTYLLIDPFGYYWVWYCDENGKIEINGPHSEKTINLDPINVENPFWFKPDVV